MTDLTAIRERHRLEDHNVCGCGHDQSNCDATALLAALDAAREDAARLAEALRDLAYGVGRDADENQSISGYVGARLSDAADVLRLHDEATR